MGDSVERIEMKADTQSVSSKEYEAMRRKLRSCINELCGLCGNYREAHLGACGRCRWSHELSD